VPSGASAWLKGDAGAGDTGWLWRSEQPIDPHSSGKIVVRTFTRRLRADAFDLHISTLPLSFRHVTYGPDLRSPSQLDGNLEDAVAGD